MLSWFLGGVRVSLLGWRGVVWVMRGKVIGCWRQNGTHRRSSPGAIVFCWDFEEPDLFVSSDLSWGGCGVTPFTSRQKLRH